MDNIKEQMNTEEARFRKAIGAKIKELRKNAEMDVDQVGAVIGKSGKTISAWEVGRGEPDGAELLALCRLFNVDVTAFYACATPIIESSDFVEVPIYGSIAAGTPIEMIEIEDTFPIARSIIERLNGFTEDGDLSLFLLKVKGESMNRILPNGCYAVIKPCNEIDRDNQPYAICVNGYDATIKRVHKLANGFELVPDSTDPTYRPQIFDYNEPGTEIITIIGRVIYYVLPFDWGF